MRNQQLRTHRTQRTQLSAIVLERAEAGTGTTVELVAVDDITSTAVLAHLLKFDSTYGRLRRTVACDDTSTTVAGHRITVTAERDPAALAWGAPLGVDVVMSRPAASVPARAPACI